jgi:hypothetical protein
VSSALGWLVIQVVGDTVLGAGVLEGGVVGAGVLGGGVVGAGLES